MKIHTLAPMLVVAVAGVLVSCMMPTTNAMLNPPIDSVPGKPSLLSPSDGTIISDAILTFVFGNADNLVANPGVITTAISRESELTKTITVQNQTGRTLTGFNAYMRDIQLYGPSGLDWILVDFEAPKLIENADNVIVILNIFPQNLPGGTYERELVVETLAVADDSPVTTNVQLNIIVYGPPPSNVLIYLNPETICEGDKVTLRVTAGGVPIAVGIWLGSAKLGTTDINGELEFDAPLINDLYLISARIEDQIIGTSNLPVYEKIEPQILIPENVGKGDPIEGQVLDEDGDPLSEIVVVCDGQSSYTDEAGYFSLPTRDLEERIYSVRTLEKLDFYPLMIMYPQSSALVMVVGKSFVESVMPYVFALAIVIIIAIVILFIAKWSRPLQTPSRPTR